MTDQSPGQQLMDQLELDDALSRRVGTRLATELQLKEVGSDLYQTETSGKKTDIGLARLAARILAEED